MPTGTLRRVRTIVTGVAGSPYYLVGYFSAESGTAQDCVDAWSDFVIGPAVNGKLGSTWTTEGEVELVNPVTGDTIGLEDAVGIDVLGTTDYDLLPTSNQALVRWRTGNYVAGREVRGRTNLPLQSVGSIDDAGNLNSTVINGYRTRAATLIDDPATVHVIWSKKNGLWWATQTASVWEKLSVLRSRRD